VFVDELGLLIGPAIFVVNDSTEVAYTYDRQKTQRSFWSYGAVGNSGSTDGQSLKKFVNERRTARRHLVRIVNESTSAVRSQRLRNSSALRACNLRSHM